MSSCVRTCLMLIVVCVMSVVARGGCVGGNSRDGAQIARSVAALIRCCNGPVIFGGTFRSSL